MIRAYSATPPAAKQSTRYTPEKDLLIAVLDRAIRDLIGEASVSWQDRRLAVNWIFYEKPEEPYSFAFICDELNLSDKFLTWLLDIATKAKTKG